MGRGSIYHGKGIDILWVGGRHILGRRVDLPWVGG